MQKYDDIINKKVTVNFNKNLCAITGTVEYIPRDANECWIIKTSNQYHYFQRFDHIEVNHHETT